VPSRHITSVVVVTAVIFTVIIIIIIIIYFNLIGEPGLHARRMCVLITSVRLRIYASELVHE
jgi:hypothetical protein